VSVDLQIVLLRDPTAFQRTANGVAVLGLDERHVVHQEDVGSCRRCRRRSPTGNPA
jgi:hypothetical protein